MFKFLKVSTELAVVLLLTGFILAYVLLTRYLALVLLIAVLVFSYRMVKHHHKKMYELYEKIRLSRLPNPPDEFIDRVRQAYKDGWDARLEDEVDKFREELNKD